jgi:hypothetical protein
LHLDQVAQPALQAGLHGELQRGGQLGAVGGEDQLQQPAAKIGPVDALARVGEQELLDHVADVVDPGSGPGGAPAAVEVNGKSMFI